MPGLVDSKPTSIVYDASRLRLITCNTRPMPWAYRCVETLTQGHNGPVRTITFSPSFNAIITGERGPEMHAALALDSACMTRPFRTAHRVPRSGRELHGDFLGHPNGERARTDPQRARPREGDCAGRRLVRPPPPHGRVGRHRAGLELCVWVPDDQVRRVGDGSRHVIYGCAVPRSVSLPRCRSHGLPGPRVTISSSDSAPRYVDVSEDEVACIEHCVHPLRGSAWVAAGGWRGRLTVWMDDVAADSNVSSKALRGHTADVVTLSYDPGTNLLVSGDA